MQQITVDIPEDLALRLNPLRSGLPRILELGLREWNGGSTDKDNLAIACTSCNKYKGSDLASIDPVNSSSKFRFSVLE
jgi:hypothetical protein